MSAIIAALHKHDLPFYLHRTKVSDAKKIIAAESGQKLTSVCLRKKKGALPLTMCGCFRCLVNTHCNYYLQIRRKSTSPHMELDSAAWDRLKLFVEKDFEIMKGMTLEEGAEFVKSKMPTNMKQLLGLPSRLHFWQYPAKNG